MYFAAFLKEANSAAGLPLEQVRPKVDSCGSLQMTVTFQTTGLPACHGIGLSKRVLKT